MNTDKAALNHVSEKIIGCGFIVSSTLGVGFLEKVYENALALELRKAGLSVEQQHNVTVYYDGVVVGMYAADLLAENAILVELKAVTALDTVHRAQCINYLKGTRLRLCLLFNFGNPRLEIKRVVNDP
jgi:GxxExxY protein